MRNYIVNVGPCFCGAGKFSSLNMYMFVRNNIGNVGPCFCDAGEFFCLNIHMLDGGGFAHY